MALKTIGTSGDYTSIAAWSAYVKALGTLTANETGELIDDKNYTHGANSDLNFTSSLVGSYTITFRAESTVKHDGDFGNGARVEASARFSGVYQATYVTIEDFSLRNTETSFGGARCFLNSPNSEFYRVIAKTDSTGGNCDCFESVYIVESCRAEGGTMGFEFNALNSTSGKNLTAVGCTTGFKDVNTTVTLNNCATYNCTTDYSGTWGTSSNNASEDGTHPGTSGVTITANPFDVDGYTPSASGQLDGAGTNLSISLDAANNSFNNPPSIGAYEVIATGGGGDIVIFRRRIQSCYN